MPKNYDDQDWQQHGLKTSSTMQALASHVAAALERAFPSRRLGFFLIVFDETQPGEPPLTDGRTSYVTSADRESTVALLKETIKQIESRPTGHRQPPHFN